MKNKNHHDKNPNIFVFIYIWSKMLSSFLIALLKLSKTSSPQKLFDYDCVKLYYLSRREEAAGAAGHGEADRAGEQGQPHNQFNSPLIDRV